MDKFFLFLGVHKFGRFAAVKFAFICGLVLLATLAIRVVYRGNIPGQALIVMLIGLTGSITLLGSGIALFQLMRKTLDASTFVYFDQQLLQALNQESASRSIPITWNMVAKQVIIVRNLNLYIAKKSRDAIALKQQQAWLTQNSV